MSEAPAPTVEATPVPKMIVVTATPNPQTEGWAGMISPEGYEIQYPGDFTLEERAQGFYVLIPPDAQSPMHFAYAIDERPEMTLEQKRAEIEAGELVDPVFTELTGLAVSGFIVEGTVGPGYGEGREVKQAYLGVNDHMIIFTCQGEYCASELFDRVLSTIRRRP